MRPSVIVASFVVMLAQQAAPETEPPAPAWVNQASEALAADRILSEINRWPRRLETPKPCQPIRVELANAQARASDGLKTILWADLERQILWVEVVRGVDGRSEYRGPMRLSDSSSFRVAQPDSIRGCRVAAPDAPDDAA